MEYSEFLQQKAQGGEQFGFAPVFMPDFLFDFQQALVDWSVRKGRAAIFADCGLGKTPIQLVWAENVARKTRKRVLILTPLAVASQTVQEGIKFGIDCKRSHKGELHRITVTNYERLHQFNPSDFAGVVCDECFPPDTLIDVFNIDKSLELRCIKDMRQGDSIINAQGEDYVKEIYKRKINRAVQISINGENITSSENHPYFTMYGWKSAQDLQPGDYIMATSEAMRLVWGSIHSEIYCAENAAVLRDILLSEMENEDTREYYKSAQPRSSKKERYEKKFMAPEWKSNGNKRIKENSGIEPDAESRNEGESVGYIAENGAQTFRAWGKWSSDDIAAAINEGCSFRKLDTGIFYITGKTKSGFSNMLQGRLRESRIENSNRNRRDITSQQKGTRQEERYNAGFSRVDSVEILEQGHPELEKYRNAEGDIYFYDIKAARHPSFSVNGLLVHNSSILKNFKGQLKSDITQFMRKVPYRLLVTATPSPNDFDELGTSSEALGYLGYMDMLNRFFKNDQNTSKVGRFCGQNVKWRLKGHAELPFWRWVCSWGRAIRKPSDLGFDDSKFILPKLVEIEHTVDSNYVPDGMLFAMPAVGMKEQRKERKNTIDERCQKIGELVNDTGKPAIVWCHMNDEGDLLERLIPDAVQVSGKDSDDRKEEKLMAFATGKERILITKPVIGAWGLNFQHCSHMTFFPSHSFEQYYQGVRRCWRFGQKNDVRVDIITTEGEQRVLANLQRKAVQADKMFVNLVNEMNNVLAIDRKNEFIKKEAIPSWL